MDPKSRDKYLRRKYGISLKQYEFALKKQKNSCALCGKHRSEFTRSLAQDHNHKTGINRGIVCFYCNKYRIARHDLHSSKILFEYMLKYEVVGQNAMLDSIKIQAEKSSKAMLASILKDKIK